MVTSLAIFSRPTITTRVATPAASLLLLTISVLQFTRIFSFVPIQNKYCQSRLHNRKSFIAKPALGGIHSSLSKLSSTNKDTEHASDNINHDWNSDNSSNMPLMSSSSPVKTLVSTRDFLDCVDNNSDDLSVVFFHAHYCKVCQRANIQYRKIAHNLGSDSTINFYRFETSHLSADHLKALGVTSFPFVQVYRQGTCVVSYPANRNLGKVQSLEHSLPLALKDCQSRSKGEWKDFIDAHSVEIANNKRARQALSIEPALQGPLITLTHPIQLLILIEPQSQFDMKQQYFNDYSVDNDNSVGSSNDSNGSTDNDIHLLTVVMFHSHFVDACLRAQQQLRRIVDYYTSLQKNDKMPKNTFIQFARIETSVFSDANLRDLGILTSNGAPQNLPYIQVYHGADLVAATKTGPSYMFKRNVFGILDKLIAQKDWQTTLIDSKEMAQKNRDILNKIKEDYYDSHGFGNSEIASSLMVDNGTNTTMTRMINM